MVLQFQMTYTLKKRCKLHLPFPNIKLLNHDASSTLQKRPLSELRTTCRIYMHIISQLTREPPIPQALPEDIPSLVGGIFHMLAEGSPQRRFHRRGLSHIPHSTVTYSQGKTQRFWRVSNPCG